MRNTLCLLSISFTIFYFTFPLITAHGGNGGHGGNGDDDDDDDDNDQEQVDKCSLIKDCFNCSSFTFEDVTCKWNSDHTCVSTSLASSLSTSNVKWYESYSECEADTDALNLSALYCNNADSNELPLQAEIKNKDNLFGSVNLYCYWSIDIESSKSLSINFTKSINNTGRGLSNEEDDEFYALELVKDDQTEKILYLKENSYYDSFDSVVKITFRYLMKSPKPEMPFSMSIFYEKETLASYMTVLIVIGVVIVLCITSCIIFWYCGRAMIRKNRNREQAGRNRGDVNSNRSSDNNSINPNQMRNNVDTNRNKENETIKQNRLCLISLFQNEYKAIEYDQQFNKYATNCTICLENYIPAVLVIKINCNHVFHSKCLKTWCEKNIKHPKCPNCMKDIIINSNDYAKTIAKEEEASAPMEIHYELNNVRNNYNINPGNQIANRRISIRQSNADFLMSSDRASLAPERQIEARHRIRNDGMLCNRRHTNLSNTNLITILRSPQYSNNDNNVIGININSPQIPEIVLEDVN